MGAGIAKLLASRLAAAASKNGLRIDGCFGYSKEYEVERLYRDRPCS
jgi:alkylation response protein AidB-like acyl-CoA dehydrogenase